MATKHGVSINMSRFACLDISDEEKDKTVNSSASSSSKNAKKKARKKKKNASEAVTTNEIRNLAFSKPVSKKAIENIHQQLHPAPAQPTPIVAPPGLQPPMKDDWDEWQKKDEEFVVDQFQRDLESALRLSEMGVNAHPPKKKGKKNVPMSLEEFSNATIDQTTPHQNTLDPSVRLTGYCPEEVDPNYFQADVVPEQIPPKQQNTKNKRRKKKNTDTNNLDEILAPNSNTVETVETNGVANGIDNASRACFQNELETKDMEILRLNSLVDTLKDELNQVKKRNKQLCFILGQGEMKEKSEVLMQVEQLTTVKNELSEQLAEMHTSLEQERSKVSTLKLELSKHQGERTKTKSFSEQK